MSRILSLLFGLSLCWPLLSQNNILPRHPALNSDGSKLAFSWQGDIWIYNFSENRSARLTVNESYEASPVRPGTLQRLVCESD